jgi:heat shock protein HslJ
MAVSVHSSFARRGALVALLFAALVGGCSALVPSPQIGRWELQTVGGVKAVFPARLIFTTSDITIDTGCNTGAAQYRLDGGKLTLEGGAFTLVGCGDGALAIQDGAFRAMAKGATASFSDGVLTLDVGTGQPVLVFRRGAGS